MFCKNAFHALLRIWLNMIWRDISLQFLLRIWTWISEEILASDFESFIPYNKRNACAMFWYAAFYALRHHSYARVYFEYTAH